MTKWKYRGGDDADHLAKVEKTRRSKDKLKKHNRDGTQFELAMDQWTKADTAWFPARVVEVHKRYAFISPEAVENDIDTRDVWLSTVARRHLQSKRGERNNIVVGDKVLCRPTNDKDVQITTDLPCCVIEHIAPRRSRIARRDPMVMEREHVLASNMDQLLIVGSYASPGVKWGLIDRYLVLAAEENIPAIIVINKEDLLKGESQEFKEKCETEIAYFRNLGYTVFSLQVEHQTYDDPTIRELHGMMDGKTTILSGHSGVGKSSLVNLFKPEIHQEVEENSNINYKGRHTTSYASMIKLGRGGYVIDTPGIRSFVLRERGPIELSYGFVEMRGLVNKCKFRECRHIDEPGCAVMLAVAEGTISERRYTSYKGILTGLSGREGRTRDDSRESSGSDTNRGLEIEPDDDADSGA
ncbi:MAG: ribosome small subunit-dependent GTPase A [Chitinophagaceae bacterium]|nr:ribosome small subunit-dependent GTPase A [Oligoflexus sp.]